MSDSNNNNINKRIIAQDDAANKRIKSINNNVLGKLLFMQDMLMMIAMFLDIMEEVKTLVFVCQSVRHTTIQMIRKIYYALYLPSTVHSKDQWINCSRLFGNVPSVSARFNPVIDYVHHDRRYKEMDESIHGDDEILPVDKLQQEKDVLNEEIACFMDEILPSYFKKINELRLVFKRTFQYSSNMKLPLSVVDRIMKTLPSLQFLQLIDAGTCGMLNYPSSTSTLPVCSTLQYLLLGVYDLTPRNLEGRESTISELDRLLGLCPSLLGLQYTLIGCTDLMQGVTVDQLPGVNVACCSKLEYLCTVTSYMHSFSSMFTLPRGLKTVFYTTSVGAILPDFRKYAAEQGIAQNDEKLDIASMKDSVKSYDNVRFVHLTMNNEMNDPLNNIELDLALDLMLFPNVEYLTLRFDADSYAHNWNAGMLGAGMLGRDVMPNLMQGYTFHIEADLEEGPFGNVLSKICSALSQEVCRPLKLRHLRLLLDVTCKEVESWQQLVELVNSSSQQLESLTIEMQLTASYMRNEGEDNQNNKDDDTNTPDMSINAQMQRHITLQVTEFEMDTFPQWAGYQRGLQYLKQHVRKSLALYIFFYSAEEKDHQPKVFYCDGFQDPFQAYLEAEHPRETSKPMTRKHLAITKQDETNKIID